MLFLKKIYLAFTQRERVAFLVSSAIAVVSFAIVAGIFFVTGTKAVPVPGGEYTEGAVGQPEYVNPVTATNETDLDLVKMIYSNVPDIADVIQASSSGKVWTVRLKENLHWQDGQKLTSDDVIFTVQSIQDPDARSPQFASWQGVTVSRVSELEVQFTLAMPYAFFADTLKNLYILPKHIFADAPPGNWQLSDYNLKPVGSGPYQFASFDRTSDGFIADYHLTAWGGSFAARPLIQNFDFQFFHNETDLVNGFTAGQIDGFAPSSPTAAASDFAAIGRPYNVFAWRTPGYYAVFFNQSNNIALQDPAVRAALSAAVDRSALITQIATTTWAVPDFGPIPSGAIYSSDQSFQASQLQSSSSSSDAIAAALDAAGWTIDPTTGIRAKTIKKVIVPLTITLTVPQIDFLVATANALQAAWQKIGAQVTITTDSPDTIDADVIQNRSYEALLFGNILGPSSDLYSFWDSSQRFSPGFNLAIYSDPAVDKLIETARATMNNASASQEFATAQDDIVADAPAVFLFSPDDLYVTDKTVQGIATSNADGAADVLPDPSDRFREVPQWYLQTARVLK